MAPQRREAIIADCVSRLEAHVARLSGIRGMSLKAGLAALESVRPGAVRRATEVLLPEFASALEPLYQQFRASGEKSFAAFVEPRRGEARDALLAVMDARADRGTHRALVGIYRRLRGTLAGEIDLVLPDLIRALGKQLR